MPESLYWTIKLTISRYNEIFKLKLRKYLKFMTTQERLLSIWFEMLVCNVYMKIEKLYSIKNCSFLDKNSRDK